MQNYIYVRSIDQVELVCTGDPYVPVGTGMDSERVPRIRPGPVIVVKYFKKYATFLRWYVDVPDDTGTSWWTNILQN